MKITMVLHRGIVFMRCYFVFVLLFSTARCDNEEKKLSSSSIKSMIIKEIMKKVSNITLNNLSNARPEKKEIILDKIEHKLRKSAKNMGPDGNKYIRYIMDEFISKTLTKNTQNATDSVVRKSTDIKPKQKTEPHIMNPEAKKEIIKGISDKIQTLARKFMKYAKTVESKKEILEKIKKKIEDSAKQKHKQLHAKHEELKAYSSLIAQGLEESIQKLLENEGAGRRAESKTNNEAESRIDPEETKQNIESIENHAAARRMEFQPQIKVGTQENKVQENKNKHSTDKEDDQLRNNEMVMDIEEINKFKNLVSQSLPDTSIGQNCDELVEITCLGIRSFNQIGCGEGKTVSIEYLCNGVVDCLNKVDEMNCSSQAMERVRKATEVMTEIESSLNHKCFAKNVDGSILSAQNQILRDVLQTQMDFLEKHVKSMRGSEKREQVPDDIYIKRTVNDISVILSTLSYALDGTLCAEHVDPDHNPRKFNDLEVIDEFEEQSSTREPNWSPKLCTCLEQFCKNVSCEAPCKRVCWQKYTLNHLGCQAISGATSVSLSELCDGKLDCFDESDETSCATVSKSIKQENEFDCFEAKVYYLLQDADVEDTVTTHSLSEKARLAINTYIYMKVKGYGRRDMKVEFNIMELRAIQYANFSKFEASRTYSDLLDFLSTKYKSYEFIGSQNKFIALLGLVRQLQKQTIKTNTDNHIIKSLRDECFNLLVSIYDDYIKTSHIDELDNRYTTLLSINEKLVNALKRSRTGNEHIIPPEGCYCRDGRCALRRCNKNCIQACLAESALTKYECGNGTSVPIDAICNRRKDCPSGVDEENCVQEVCRGHHLVVLRHNLRNVSAPYSSTLMGEVLKSWRDKVSAALYIAENNERPNHKIMVDILSSILHDLVTAFAAMEDYRRVNSDFALKEFTEISNKVKQALKSCSH